MVFKRTWVGLMLPLDSSCEVRLGSVTPEQDLGFIIFATPKTHELTARACSSTSRRSFCRPSTQHSGLHMLPHPSTVRVRWSCRVSLSAVLRGSSRGFVGWTVKTNCRSYICSQRLIYGLIFLLKFLWDDMELEIRAVPTIPATGHEVLVSLCGIQTQQSPVKVSSFIIVQPH